MLRTVLALLLSSFLAAAAARASEPERHLKLCLAADGKAACEKARAAFANAYRRALRGDYQARRNVAYMLKRGHADVVLPSPVSACAWRLLIVASGSPSVDAGDTGNVRVDCGSLSEADSAAARVEARALAARIAAGSSRRATGGRRSRLDGSAEPL